jgi:hypothetical protein
MQERRLLRFFVARNDNMALGDCFASSSLAMTIGGGDCFALETVLSHVLPVSSMPRGARRRIAEGGLAMTLRRSPPQHVIARSKQQSKLLVDRIASGFQKLHHMQERRLLRFFVARNDNRGRRLLRPGDCPEPAKSLRGKHDQCGGNHELPLFLW